MAVSVFDHPLTGVLFAGDETAGFFTPAAEIEAIVRFERALARVEAAAGLIPAASRDAIETALDAVETDDPALAATLGQAMARDGVLLPGLLKVLRVGLPEAARPHLHFGATSQDAMDTGLMLRLKACTAALEEQVAALDADLADLAARFGANPLMGHTRMQPALPITVADRIASWRGPLIRQSAALARHRTQDFCLQFGGAVGTLEAFGDRGPALRAALAADLGLADAPQWHSQRDRIVNIATTFATLAGVIGKFGQDIALMAQEGREIALQGGGGSSAMAHKQNPVTAEILVSLGRFAAVQAGGLQQALIHEQERSGAAWSLEWMLLPSVAAAAGAAVRRGRDLAGQITRLGQVAG